MHWGPAMVLLTVPSLRHFRSALRLVFASACVAMLPPTSRAVEPKAPVPPVDQTNVRHVGDLDVRVDPALDIEMVAGSDLVKWPIVADWDSAGRLVVAECGGVAKPIVEHNKQLLHRIVRLVDTNNDGKFDKRIVAADQLAFPEGVLCVGNSMLVSTPPQIWKLTDENNDGVCEKREIWYDPGTITGCANDLHGPYMGRDGWIYWCKGAFAEQTHQLTDGKQLVTKASHIFRRRFEGGPVEPVMTGGMDNPVEMAISHSGERFFTSTFLQHPADGKRDGIAHAVYGGVYGKPHDVINGHKRTGDLMPIMTHLGPAAPSGLICLESDRLLGAEQHDILVAAQFNLHKVTAHTLIPQGASFKTQDRELVGSERIDFHPTDIIEARDGSLLVIDTGGWYNLCCPSSHVDQSIAMGGIYRLTSKTTRQVKAQTPVDWDALTIDEASAIVNDSKKPVRDRQQAAWRLCRLGAPAQTLLVNMLRNSEPSLRQIAAHALSVQRVRDSAKTLEVCLAGERDTAVIRAMAEALGRIGSASSVDTLMSCMPKANSDRMCEHSLLYAMIELNAPEQVSQHLGALNSRRAAMLVLDQLGKADLLDPKQIVASLSVEDADLRRNVADILSRHAEWADKGLEGLDRAMASAFSQPAIRGDVATVVAAWVSQPAVAELMSKRLADVATRDSASDATQVQSLVEIMSGIRNQKLPSAWLPSLVKLFERGDNSTRQSIARWVSTMKVDGQDATVLSNALMKRASEANEGNERLRYLSALPTGTTIADSSLERYVSDALLGKHGPELIGEAGVVLSRIKLSAATAESLADNLGKVQPLQLMLTLTAIAGLGNDALDEKVLKQLSELPAARTLPLESVTSLYRSRGNAVKQQAKSAVETLGKPPADVEARLDQLLGQMKSGDASRGFQVFRSAKAACSACHRIGYVGGTVGPELTRIGATRTRRALLEAILFPNARLEQSYTPLRVLTVDGQILNGIVVRESNGELELITGANQRSVVKVEDIEQRSPSPVSIMPAGLEQQLTMDELSDLLTLLESAGKR